MSHLCHSETHMRDLTSPYTSFNSWKHSVGVFFFFFQFHNKFQIYALLNFHPSHESGRATHHGLNQTKLRGKPTDIDIRVQSCSIWEGPRSITFHPLPTHTVFPGTVCTVVIL
jgi:hypothetical protein